MDFRKVKAAIFDLDGTLLDTLADIGTGLNAALCRFGLPTHSIEDYRQRVGHGSRKLMEVSAPEGTDKDILEQALQFYLSYYPEHCTIHTKYYPGVREFLQQLAEKGIRLAIISNKTETTGKKVIAHYFPDVDWAFVWGNNYQRPLKPATEAGVLACEELGVKPEEVLYVGDGDTDMEFASKMGFLAVGVTWGYRDRDQLLAAGAELLVDSFDELAKLMNQA